MQSVTLGASGTLFRSAGVGALPGFTTATYPSTTTINQILYSSSANTITGLATANSSVLVTSAGGIPSLSSTLPNINIGTPTAGVLTNCTGLPVGSITGLGTGVATALAANVNGSGAISLTTSPTFVTPILGLASATGINFGGSTLSTYLAAGSSTPTFTFATPGDLSVTYSVQSCNYYQIGGLVFYNYILVFTPTFTTASGVARFSVLPATTSVTSYSVVGNKSANITYPVGCTQIAAAPQSGTNYFQLVGFGTATAQTALTTANFVSTQAHTIGVSGVYAV